MGVDGVVSGLTVGCEMRRGMCVVSGGSTGAGRRRRASWRWVRDAAARSGWWVVGSARAGDRDAGGLNRVGVNARTPAPLHAATTHTSSRSHGNLPSPTLPSWPNATDFHVARRPSRNPSYFLLRPRSSALQLRGTRSPSPFNSRTPVPLHAPTTQYQLPFTRQPPGADTA